MNVGELSNKLSTWRDDMDVVIEVVPGEWRSIRGVDWADSDAGSMILLTPTRNVGEVTLADAQAMTNSQYLAIAEAIRECRQSPVNKDQLGMAGHIETRLCRLFEEADPLFDRDYFLTVVRSQGTIQRDPQVRGRIKRSEAEANEW